jgi:hypothetical protein
MDAAVLIAQCALALLFLGAGATKVLQSRDRLLTAPNMAWAQDFSPSWIKVIGALEVLGAVGLVLPWVTGVAEVLVPLAATGLALVMAGAAVVHGRRGETRAIPVTVVLACLALLVAVVRF